MTIYTPQDWIDGDATKPVSAARLAYIEAGVLASYQRERARVFHNAAQSIGSGTLTALAFNSERVDTDLIHETVTNNSRLTCKTAGFYLIGGSAEFADPAATIQARIAIRLNGSTLLTEHRPPNYATGATIPLSIATAYELAVNDYVELMVFQNKGSGLNVNATGNKSPEFWMGRT